MFCDGGLDSVKVTMHQLPKLLHIPAVKNRQDRYEVYSWGEDAIENFLNVFTINCLYWMASVVIYEFFAFWTDLQYVRKKMIILNAILIPKILNFTLNS